MTLQVAKNPARVVIFAILAFNIIFFLFAAFVIRSLSLSGTEQMGFFEAVFYTLTMILDAGCIQFVIEDIGQANVTLALICLSIVIIGMISFTGAVIGYITNYISTFIERSSSGSRKLNLSNHGVILNWNTRASEIINDLLYADKKITVVVLVSDRREEIEKEINERLSDTVRRENNSIKERAEDLKGLKRFIYLRKNAFRNRVTFIVREGDVFSSKQLSDISLERASTVIILGDDKLNTVCAFGKKEIVEDREKGNSQTVKTLMQVADITASERSFDNQKIIVEITDPWTADLVNKIIRAKQVNGKCNIIPVNVNRILGQILSQFSLMPELNLVYNELFSNKGAAFYPLEMDVKDDHTFIKEYLASHLHAIPLTGTLESSPGYSFFTAEHESDIQITSKNVRTDASYSVSVNDNFEIEPKTVIILGHNSKCRELMDGFDAFCGEWDSDYSKHRLNIVVIDDPQHLEQMDYYIDYPFVREKVPVSMYDPEKRQKTEEVIRKYVCAANEDTSILILSDDLASEGDIDANALAELVYVQDIIKDLLEEKKLKERTEVDIVVEIIDPKHHDIVNSYSVNNVVISNRYISKMITQIGSRDVLYSFYSDILTYDDRNAVETGEFESKEIYIKKVSQFFKELPKPTKAADFIRVVYDETSKGCTEEVNPSLVLGYVRDEIDLHLFTGDLSEIDVELTDRDKLIVYSNH